MRYVLLDRITLLEPPDLARAIKCASLGEDYFVELHGKRHVMVWRVLKRGMSRKIRGVAEETVAGWWMLMKYIWSEYPAKYAHRKEKG